VTSIDVLNDDVLLVIFDFCVADGVNGDPTRGIEAWQSLVHVCRRWRSIVFQSPRRLNLQLYCTPETPAKDTLDIWPALPLIVWGDMASSGTDNIIAALGQSNRVCRVILWSLEDWQLEEVLAAMRVPFPELTDLQLCSDDEPPVIPDSFLDGSAPRLQIFELSGISFPGLPNLLLSATRLVHLTLFDIPYSGYISPEAMVNLLCALSSLRSLSLEFQFHQESRILPPPKRSILPALDKIYFQGVTEYLEDLVTFIDAPQLKYFYINFFSQIDFDTPRLAQFINRTPKLSKRDVHVKFDQDFFTRVELPAGSGTLKISISSEPDRQLSSIEQVCNSSLHPLSTVENLYIENQLELPWSVDAWPVIENTLWLQLLLPFTAVKNLYLSKKSVPGIAAALQELVGGRIAKVLPSLQNIFVEGFDPSSLFQENFGQFITVRQLCDHPIAISVWDKDSNMKPM
jgi:hypothetical protein